MKHTTPAQPATVTTTNNIIPGEVMGESSECTLKDANFENCKVVQEHEEHAVKLLNDLTYGVVKHDFVPEVEVPSANVLDRTMNTIPSQWTTSFEKRVLLWAMRKLGGLFQFSNGCFNRFVKLNVLVNMSRTHLPPVTDLPELLQEATRKRNIAFDKLAWAETNKEIEYYDLDHGEHDELIFEYDEDRDSLNSRIASLKDLERMSSIHDDPVSQQCLKESITEKIQLLMREKLEQLFNNTVDLHATFVKDELKGFYNQKLLNDYIEKRDYVTTLSMVNDEIRVSQVNIFEMTMLGRLTTKTYLGVKLDKNDLEFLDSVRANPMFDRVIAAVEHVDKS